MQPYLLFMSFLFATVLGQSTQKFLYKAQDSVSVEPNSTLSLSLELSTASDEYLGESTMQATFDIASSEGTDNPYNILYFNYQKKEGQQCYKEWLLSGIVPIELDCEEIVDAWFISMPDCARYSHCSNQRINLTITLADQLYRINYLLVENNSTNTVTLSTCIDLELSSDNSWFYWGVGLTCLLLISLAIFIGIVFYWLLKYKRVKKMFQQFKLTQQSISKQE